MDALFPDDNSREWDLQSQFQRHVPTLNMAAPLPPQQQQHSEHTFSADAYAAATVLRDNLADNLAQWHILEARLRNARREVAGYYKSVFARCDAVVTKFDNLSAHEVGQPTELQIFCTKFRSLQRDLDRVLPMMTADCDPAEPAPSAAQPALIASAGFLAADSADPPMPPLPGSLPPVVAPPYQAPPNDGAANDGAACNVTSSTRGLTTESSVDSMPIRALLHSVKFTLPSMT